MSEIKEEWAKSIISQALIEIKTTKDISRVIEKVKGTALYQRKDLFMKFLKLVELKEKLLLNREVIGVSEKKYVCENCKKEQRITNDRIIVRMEAITKTKETHIFYDKYWCVYCGAIL